MFFKRRLKNDRTGRRFPAAVRLGLAGLTWLVGVTGGLGLCACQSMEEEPGVVARVDGRPIRLGRLQRQYDADLSLPAGAGGTELAGLRERYGAALAGLVVQELAEMELERLGLAVTPEEVDQAEAQVRADYPDAAAFEQVAAEECLDLVQWRERLRARLTVAKLKERILRTRVTVAPSEAQAVYAERQAEFAAPERIRARLFQAADRPRLEDRLRQAVRQQQGGGGEARDSGDVVVRDVLVRPERLPEPWRKALRGLSPGQAGPVVGEKGAWQGFVLLERLPARPADPAQAYAQVERLLLERKLEETLSAWVEDRLRQVRITASPALRGGDGADR